MFSFHSAHLAATLHTLWLYTFGFFAVILLALGFDDLIPLAIVAAHHVRRLFKRQREPGDAQDVPESRIAIFVPCWKESGVIGNMVRHNLTAIRYRNFDFFLGTYPNDEATVLVAEQLALTYTNVHGAICPSPGPTSKADCLNCLYRAMQRFEEQHGVRFTTIVLHDAEDLIHPEAISLINRERATYDMVQVPVLPLPTPFYELVHGVYCDEFSEFQTIDMHARQFSGAFVPSCGVGTGFAREILERLDRERGQVFDAESLTEDYEIGLYIRSHGYRQLFAPIKHGEFGFRATREFFPRTTHLAIRQRTRWVTGIALQCWERHGWKGSWWTRYWLWRDRKGLFASPLSVAMNAIFVAGLFDYIASAVQHRDWFFAMPSETITVLAVAAMLLQIFRLGLRMIWVARIFGPLFAIAVPMRVLLANLINGFASIRAIRQFRSAKRGKRKLVWHKTDHAYPAHAFLTEHQRDFDSIITHHGFISREALDEAKDHMLDGADLGEYLLNQNLITDENLCRALSLSGGVQVGRFDAAAIKPSVRRSLPTHLTKRFCIIPVDLRAGRLTVAGRKALTPEAIEIIKTFTSLAIDFHVVTRQNFAELEETSGQG